MGKSVTLITIFISLRRDSMRTSSLRVRRIRRRRKVRRAWGEGVCAWGRGYRASIIVEWF